MTERIDSHHHLWRYNVEEYGWISGEMEVLRHDFLPGELGGVLKAQGIDGAVAVQARQTLEETAWLLQMAAEHSFIRGVVGWAPLASADFPAMVERLAGNERLKGLRHVIQDEPDDEYILDEEFNRGIDALKGTGLVYDILVLERHLPQTIQFVDRHPEQIFVLDHLAKPRIRDGGIGGSTRDSTCNWTRDWKRNLGALAERQNVYCKLSGMVTEAHWQNWSVESLRPYFDVALEGFGAGRLMFGSDWPVCLLAASYERWMGTVEQFVRELSAAEQDRIWGETAMEVYRL